MPNKRKKAQTVQTVENTEPPAQATRKSKTSEELIQASEGAEEDLMQEGVNDAQHARSEKEKSNTGLQSMVKEPTVAMRKQLKTTKKGRQSGNNLKSCLQESVSLANLTGHRSNKETNVISGSFDAGQFQKPQVIEAWATEMTTPTKEDIPGKFCVWWQCSQITSNST